MINFGERLEKFLAQAVNMEVSGISTKVGWLPIKKLQRQTASDHLRLWMIRPEPPNTELENNSSR